MKLVVGGADKIDWLLRGIPREVMWHVNDLIESGELKDDCEVRIEAVEDDGWWTERERDEWELKKTFGDENGEKWEMWMKDGVVCMEYEHCEYDLRYAE